MTGKEFQECREVAATILDNDLKDERADLALTVAALIAGTVIKQMPAEIQKRALQDLTASASIAAGLTKAS